MSVLAFGQEVPTNTPDTSAVESTEAAAPESTETNMESTEVIVESTEDAAESAEESATETAEDEDALETLQKALVEEEQTVAENSDSEGDSPDVDIEDSEEKSQMDLNALSMLKASCLELSEATEEVEKLLNTI